MKSFIVIAGLLASTVAFAMNRESGGRGSANAVYVDFQSMGMGIDRTSQQVYEELYNAADSRGEVLNATMNKWGDDGQVRYCVHFANATQRLYFVQALAPSILSDTSTSSFKRTKVYGGFDCYSFEAATEQDLSKYLN